MRTFKLIIVAPEQVLFDGEVQYCGITDNSGSIGYEAMHEPMIAVLKNNTDIKVRDSAGIEKLIPVAEGILSFKQNICSIVSSKQTL